MAITKHSDKKFIFRADGNSKIGVGHIMRTLTIATALRKQLEADPILFICADEDSAAVVESRGFQSQVLGTAYDHMEDELPLWQQLGIENAVILIDSYYATDEYLTALRQYGRVAILDDLQEHAYPVDVVINYNVFANPEIYKKLYDTNIPELNINPDSLASRDMMSEASYIYGVNTDTKYYLGAQYVPLRDEFASSNRDQLLSSADSAMSANTSQASELSLNTTQLSTATNTEQDNDGNRCRNILITTGGGDQDNIAGKIYDALSTYNACYKTENITDDSRTTYHIVSGVFNPYFQQLKQLEQDRDDLRVHHDVQDMASLISSCDIAITAGGSTIYEICSLGVPLICFSYARNQEQLVEYIGKHVAYSAGAYDKNPAKTLSTISDLINNTYSNSDVLEQISNKERQLVDGKGAYRIAGIMRHIME